MPSRGVCLVVRVIPERELVMYVDPWIRSQRPARPRREVRRERDYISSWSFVLVPVGVTRTRLLVRTRVRWSPSWRTGLSWRVFTEPFHFLAERQILLRIRDRAER